jgi:DNA-binding MarR family transcriptional regulator
MIGATTAMATTASVTELKEMRHMADGLRKAQDKFAEYLGKGDVELQAFSTYLVIAGRSDSFPMQDLQDILGLSQASVSRNVALLSVGSLANPGPRLVEAFEDPEYRRRKHVRVTARGRRLMEEIREIILETRRKS